MSRQSCWIRYHPTRATRSQLTRADSFLAAHPARASFQVAHLASFQAAHLAHFLAANPASFRAALDAQEVQAAPRASANCKS